MPLPWLLERLALDGSPGPASLRFPARRRIGWVWLRALPAVLRGLAIGSLAVALARPQTVGGVTRIAGKGVAIVVALDQSSSMNTVDFPADRGTRLIVAARCRQGNVHSLRRGTHRRPDRPGRLCQLSRSRLSADARSHLSDRYCRCGPPGAARRRRHQHRRRDGSGSRGSPASPLPRKKSLCS